MELFVTGGTGFIGSHFVNLALSEGHSVVALRRSKNSKPRISLCKEPHWIEGELDSISAKELAGSSVFVHLAAAGVDPKLSNLKMLFQINVSHSLKIWTEAVQAGMQNFLVCGSCFEYGKSGELYDYIPVSAPLMPTTPYGASKAAASLAALSMATKHLLKLQLFRPFHTFGEGENEISRFWPSLRKAALAGEDFNMTTGEQVRDFINVEVVAEKLLQACAFEGVEKGNPVIKNLGTGKPQSLRQFAEFWWKEWEADGKLNFGVVPNRANEVMRFVPEV